MSPFQYFKKFIDNSTFDIIVNQSNLYSVQKNVNHPFKLSKEEFEQWLGLSIWFNLHKVSVNRLHWSSEFRDDHYASIMTQDRWEEIKANIHFVDNSKLSGEDKIGKIRPFYEDLKAKFRQIPMMRDLCIDETIIPFKGCSSLKQYIPKKNLTNGASNYLC